MRGTDLTAQQVGAHATAHLAAELASAHALFTYAPTLGAVYIAELARSVRGGIDIGAGELASLADMHVDSSEIENVTTWASRASDQEAYLSVARRARDRGVTPEASHDDESAMRLEMRRFVEREVKPIARAIHDHDTLVPMSLVARLATLGVFGMTTSREHGGLGLGRVMMCAVTEELARGSLGVASLGTRSEIAASLIGSAGTTAQRRSWLPRIASGEVLPTAVFSEPDHGSDLAHVRTRAERRDGDFRVFGQKAWATHAARADLMILLVRTLPRADQAGLSILLGPKTRRETPPDFVDPGLSGTETKVLGYRGMKEYTLHFDDFLARADGGALLGETEGAGFKQLMETFETARIQTAARAVGVAQAALELALRYSVERVQFGRPIIEFPRIARKIGRLVCRVAAARALTTTCARRKDEGSGRFDLEAGMAKLIATRVAWEAADACVQIHGGVGYALECDASRLLLDARVLSIFEGSSEIQAHVIARRLLETRQP